MTTTELCLEFELILLTAVSWEEVADRVAEVVADGWLVPDVEAYLRGVG